MRMIEALVLSRQLRKDNTFVHLSIHRVEGGAWFGLKSKDWVVSTHEPRRAYWASKYYLSLYYNRVIPMTIDTKAEWQKFQADETIKPIDRYERLGELD